MTKKIRLTVFVLIVIGLAMFFIFNRKQSAPNIDFAIPKTQTITSNIFTYSKVASGQKYGAMTVEKVNSNNAEPVSAVNISVEFSGDVTLIGKLRAPTDNPADAGMGPDYSIYELTPESLSKLPYMETDTRSVWFGIRNPEIIKNTAIKNGDNVELRINKYYYIYLEAGVWNSADVVSVKKVE